MAATRACCLLGLLALALGCQRGPATSTPADAADTATGPDWFEDVTAARGIDFCHDPGPLGKYEMPQIMGSGSALFDFDGDGRLDIYLIQNAGPQSASGNRLFHQE